MKLINESLDGNLTTHLLWCIVCENCGYMNWIYHKDTPPLSYHFTACSVKDKVSPEMVRQRDFLNKMVSL